MKSEQINSLPYKEKEKLIALFIYIFGCDQAIILVPLQEVSEQLGLTLALFATSLQQINNGTTSFSCLFAFCCAYQTVIYIFTTFTYCVPCGFSYFFSMPKFCDGIWKMLLILHFTCRLQTKVWVYPSSRVMKKYEVPLLRNATKNDTSTRTVTALNYNMKEMKTWFRSAMHTSGNQNARPRCAQALVLFDLQHCTSTCTNCAIVVLIISLPLPPHLIYRLVGGGVVWLMASVPLSFLCVRWLCSSIWKVYCILLVRSFVYLFHFLVNLYFPNIFVRQQLLTTHSLKHMLTFCCSKRR